MCHDYGQECTTFVRKEKEKADKYMDLNTELQRVWGTLHHYLKMIATTNFWPIIQLFTHIAILTKKGP